MHTIQPAGIFRLFFSSARWRLELGDGSCTITRDGGATTVDYLSIEETALAGGLFPTLVVWIKDGQFQLKWLGCFSAGGERDAVDRKKQQAQDRAIEDFYCDDRYISHRDFCRWRESIPHAIDRVFKCAYAGLPERNEEFVRREESRFRAFFDRVEKDSLTSEQRRAAIVMEDRNLLIAAAGSGKTSAIVGKIGYILQKGVRSSQILALAFNRDAVEEMHGRFARRLGAAAKDVVVKTFHKCGLDIIAQTERARPAVASWAGDMGENTQAQKIWGGMIEGIADTDSGFGDVLVKLLTYYRWEAKPQHRFKSKSEYEQYILAMRAKRGDDEEGRRHWGAPTMNGEYVRSLEEVQIANWLYINGIEYEYEKPYEYDLARPYNPDFYYPQIGVYHEHFALDADGRAPPFFAPGYAAQAQGKRELHARNGTKLIETTSAMFHGGKVFDHLKRQLEARGVKFNEPRTFAEVTKKLRDNIIFPLYGIMHTFLKHWKSSGLSDRELLAAAKSHSGFLGMRMELFVRVMIRIRREYEARLRAEKTIDFEGMVVNAVQHLRIGDYRHPYSIILVDEFQDISRSRARLIKAMLDQNPDCKMFAVGDDWQAIYRFAGSDISVMTGFAEEFGRTAKSRLERTFRSNQGISDVAAGFVSRNPAQEQKRVRAANPVTSGVVQVVNYFTSEEVESFILRQLRELSGGDNPATVYILARYRNLKPRCLPQWQEQFDGVLDIKFSTVHSAKGQEADYVFVLGMNAGQYGFPSEMEDDPVLQLVMPRKEEYEHAEERRLFYVALTRARRKVFLLANKRSRSCFVDEILVNHPQNVYENDVGTDGALGRLVTFPNCPACSGLLVGRDSEHGEFLGCSNYPKCKYKKNIPAAPGGGR